MTIRIAPLYVAVSKSIEWMHCKIFEFLGHKWTIETIWYFVSVVLNGATTLPTFEQVYVRDAFCSDTSSNILFF